mgnify:FL=1
MTPWQYLTRVFILDKEDSVVIQYVQQEYPDRDWKDLPKYDLLTLEAWLNKAGEEGWELVKLEAIDGYGRHGDIGVVYPPAVPAWRHTYLCVFKRPANP